jgi:hypothetical protein
MANQLSSRREFLKDTVLATGLAAVVPSVLSAAGSAKLHVACNQYPWGTFYAREKRDFTALLDSGLAEVKASGNDGFEPGVGGLPQIEQMTPLLVLEQAVEAGSSNTMNVVDAFKKSTQYTRQVFARFAG